MKSDHCNRCNETDGIENYENEKDTIENGVKPKDTFSDYFDSMSHSK
jgi:hypothetical protein